MLILLSPCFFKKAMGILQSPPSVCLSVCLFIRLSRYLLNHWTISNQFWCVCVAHMNGVCNGTFFCGPGEGPKGQILFNIIKFQLQSQFQRNLDQTLCVYSQKSTRVGVSVTYMNGTCNSILPLPPPPPCGLWEDPKGQISLNLNYLVSKGAKIWSRYNQVPHPTQK